MCASLLTSVPRDPGQSQTGMGLEDGPPQTDPLKPTTPGLIGKYMAVPLGVFGNGFMTCM